MKINVVCFTGNSGLTDYSISLCKSMGSESRLITSNSIDDVFKNFGFEIKNIFRRTRHYPFDVVKLFHFAINNSKDKYIFQGPLKFPFVDGLLVRTLRIFGVKMFVIVHDVLPHYPNILSKFSYSFYYNSFEKCISHSERAKKDLTNMGITKPHLVVPHGIYDLFKITLPSRELARSRVGNYNEKDILILFFGHIETRKGIFEFVELAKACKKNSCLKFLIAGKSSLPLDKYQKLTSTIKENNNIQWHDHRISFQDVENYFSAAHIVVLPYLEGTTSGVLKLAIAFARPVLATDVGDFKEQIGDKYGLCMSLNKDLINSLEVQLKQLIDKYDFWEKRCRLESAELEWMNITKRILNFIDSH